MKQAGYRVVPFTANRQMAAASAKVSGERNTIHMLTEVDITEPRRLIREHRERTGERFSFTAYIVTCLARAIAEQPQLNSLRRGNRLIVLDDVTIGTLVERNLEGELIPEPVGIRAADKKSYRQVHEEIRAAQQESDARLGGLSGMTWVRFIPGFLLRTFIHLASRNVAMAQRYGVVAVTAVGMFGRGPLWAVPLSAATVGVAVGGIVGRPVVVDGQVEEREHLCLTLSFDHDIVDGAPAARFTGRFAQLLASGEVLREETQGEGAVEKVSVDRGPCS
jgi:pyruvate/2-oxoglutarate dehydrogenase complex dihydrolipoamide acyltransferase (E2) component